MTRCRHVRLYLAAYALSERGFKPSLRRRVARHLRHCERCRREVADCREVGRVFDVLREVRPPAGMWERIRKAARERGLM